MDLDAISKKRLIVTDIILGSRPIGTSASRINPQSSALPVAISPRPATQRAPEWRKHSTMSDEPTPTHPNGPERSDSSDRSDSSSSSSVDAQEIRQPIPIRPPLPNRKSSGTLIVPRDSSQVGPVDMEFEPGDVRAMSPRRTSEDLEAMGKEARAELHRHAKALQDSLLMIFSRIEAVKDEHDKLDNNNKFLQKYIGDLMSTSKITSTGRGRK